MKKVILFTVLVFLLMLGAVPAYAGIPTLPHAFYGSVTINDDPAPDGIEVSATVDNGTVIPIQNPVKTEGGNYGIDSPPLLVQGEIPPGATITFHVNGVEVEGVTAIFEVGGGPTEKHLEITPGSITGEVEKTIPPASTGVVDASDIADTTITVNTLAGLGDVTVTVEKYYSNPHPDVPPPADMLPRYIDIKVDNPGAIVWPMYVKQSYTHDEIDGFDEDSLRMYYFKEADNVWLPCKNTDVNPEEDYIWADMWEDEVSGSPVAIGGAAAPEPEPTPPAGGGGIGPRRVPAGTTNVRGEVSWEGVFEEPVTAFSDDELCTLTIPEGTVGLTEDLEPLDEITILREDDPPEPPEEADIVLAYDLGPDGATFEPAVTLTFSYDPADIPEGKDVLVVAYYDEVAEAWVYLEGEVDTVSKTVTVSISHFTTFAIIARAAPPPAPAAFSVTNLSVKPLEVEPKEVVTISLSVANTGGTEGSYTVVLKINGVKEADKSITIAAGKSKSVSFSVAKEKAGSYSVDVDGLSASFTVVEAVPEEEVAPPEEEEVVVPEAPAEVPPAINWPVLGLVIAATVVAGVLIFLLVRRRAEA